MDFKDKRILITGISGFIGLFLARRLSYYGAEVYGLDINPINEKYPFNFPKERAIRIDRIFSGDIRNLHDVNFALEKAKPDILFHLAANCFVPDSFRNPDETIKTNILGTYNILEAIVQSGHPTKIIFAGSSEEYGLIKKQNNLPINEENNLNPVSPYGRSKVSGEYLMVSFNRSCGVKTIICRCFNTEGPRRGIEYVTSAIVNQVIQFKKGNKNKIFIGNINAIRDWSHIEDIINGYCLVARKGKNGEIYNIGSQRANSVLSYILLCLSEVGYDIKAIETLDNKKRVENPLKMDNSKIYGCAFEKTMIDKMILNDELKLTLKDRGLIVHTDQGKVPIQFNEKLFRSEDVPILLCDITKIKKIGYNVRYTLKDIIRDQISYFWNIS